jgi:hypothetical protein
VEGLWPPPTTGRWCPKPPPGPRGWFGHTQRPKPIFPFFFFFGLSGWPDHPQRPGVASVWGWPKPPLGQKWGGPATPFLGREWLQPPRFPFFFFFFQFPSFFQKKNLKICKTTPFCPKRRHFGVEGIMGIYIFIYPLYP